MKLSPLPSVLAALAVLGIFAAPAMARSMTTEQRAVCVRSLKNSLRDPGSLKRLGSPSQENASGLIKYSAKNGFGGRTVGFYDCRTRQNYSL